MHQSCRLPPTAELHNNMCPRTFVTAELVECIGCFKAAAKVAAQILNNGTVVVIQHEVGWLEGGAARARGLVVRTVLGLMLCGGTEDRGAHMHTHTHTQKHTQAQTHRHIDTHIDTHTQPHASTDRHTDTDTQTHTHTHKNTDTDMQACRPKAKQQNRKPTKEGKADAEHARRDKSGRERKQLLPFCRPRQGTAPLQ